MPSEKSSPLADGGNRLGFRFSPLTIEDVILVEPDVFPDARGWFLEAYRLEDFRSHGIGPFVQDNLSCSRQGVLRGLHFQRPPKAQGKLVSCPSGEIWDVAVDIRPDSPTFGKWVAEHLSGDNHRMLWIPPGFAHGFVTLSGQAIVAYKVTESYAPELDAGIRWDDPDLAIPWPVSSPLVSPKDAALPLAGELAL